MLLRLPPSPLIRYYLLVRRGERAAFLAESDLRVFIDEFLDRPVFFHDDQLVLIEFLGALVGLDELFIVSFLGFVGSTGVDDDVGFDGVFENEVGVHLGVVGVVGFEGASGVEGRFVWEDEFDLFVAVGVEPVLEVLVLDLEVDFA